MKVLSIGANKPRPQTCAFTPESLIEELSWLLDNSYFEIGDLIFRQQNWSSSSRPCPFIANRTLFYSPPVMNYITVL